MTIRKLAFKGGRLLLKAVTCLGGLIAVMALMWLFFGLFGYFIAAVPEALRTIIQATFWLGGTCVIVAGVNLLLVPRLNHLQRQLSA